MQESGSFQKEHPMTAISWPLTPRKLALRAARRAKLLRRAEKILSNRSNKERPLRPYIKRPFKIPD